MKFLIFALSLLSVGLLFDSCQKDDPVPTSVTITRIDLTDYPMLDGTSNWDPSLTGSDVNPDPILSINQGTTSNIDEIITTYFPNASGGTISYSSTSTFPLTISDLTQNWAFAVRDYDSGNADSTMVSDYMGGLYFKFSDYTSGNPTTKTFTNSTGTIGFKFYLEWGF